MDSRKVVWAEGMFLRPQHFQQQERYLEFFAHSRALASEGYFWGFHELEIDVEALALGKLVLNKAVGSFLMARLSACLGQIRSLSRLKYFLT